MFKWTKIESTKKINFIKEEMNRLNACKAACKAIIKEVVHEYETTYTMNQELWRQVGKIAGVSENTHIIRIKDEQFEYMERSEYKLYSMLDDIENDKVYRGFLRDELAKFDGEKND